ncbi:DUF1769 family protein [Schizosaccharomyces japonicus yFS275]|uniref:DUF1769 family protein n=1 Tax=Schizosaccharomyces japonicus (strain yFS275 / FY16936) TaxID=402676 RepID=B6K290_SCHJY|nr:DUF1769 family protein [Schizosaccharomyces japonicus yFS275]EEB07271.2 DUF1769 family protein [Schizosaccharomyces japonicus yFS275]
MLLSTATMNIQSFFRECGRRVPFLFNEVPIAVSNEVFEGQILLRLRGYTRESSAYLRRSSDNCSLMISGRFKAGAENLTADDLMFGNVFDYHVLDDLPFGWQVMMRGLRFVDPSLEYDFHCERPYALSPLYATMTKMRFSKNQAFPLEYFEATAEDKKRRHDMQDVNKRRQVRLQPGTFFIADFCNAIIDPKSLTVVLPLVHVHISIQRFYRNHPLVYVCKRRNGDDLFAVEMELFESRDNDDDDDDNRDSDRDNDRDRDRDRYLEQPHSVQNSFGVQNELD